MTNPYQAPVTRQENSQFPSRLLRLIKHVPLAVIAGVIGGILNRSAIQFSFLLPLHPLASSGASFGAACAIVGLFVPGRRLTFVFALPMVLIVAFHVSGGLLDFAAQRFQEGAGWVEFVWRIVAGAFAGTTIIAVWLFLSRILTRQDVLRFAVIAATTAALCVVVVNATPVRISYRLLLFWTMCAWQFFMLLYLAWITSGQAADSEVVRP